MEGLSELRHFIFPIVEPKDESSTATDKNEEKEWYPQTLP